VVPPPRRLGSGHSAQSGRGRATERTNERQWDRASEHLCIVVDTSGLIELAIGVVIDVVIVMPARASLCRHERALWLW
jgi:hypothetical protein